MFFCQIVLQQSMLGGKQVFQLSMILHRDSSPRNREHELRRIAYVITKQQPITIKLGLDIWLSYIILYYPNFFQPHIYTLVPLVHHSPMNFNTAGSTGVTLPRRRCSRWGRGNPASIGISIGYITQLDNNPWISIRYIQLDNPTWGMVYYCYPLDNIRYIMLV